MIVTEIPYFFGRKYARIWKHRKSLVSYIVRAVPFSCPRFLTEAFDLKPMIEMNCFSTKQKQRYRKDILDGAVET